MKRIVVDPAPGIAVRRYCWRDCVVEVQDVGKATFWGNLVDIRRNIVINPTFIGNLTDEWELAMEAELFIRAIS